MRENFNEHTVEGDVVHIKIKDRVCTVDLEDLELVGEHRWHLDSKRYATTVVMECGKRCDYSMHRLLLGFPNLHVDHADQNPLNNCRSNLRLATYSQNLANRSTFKNNTSGFKGVCWSKKANKWMSQIQHQNHNYYLGLFDTPELAHEAYKAKAEELFGSFACKG
jgi:hypothetical protein